MKICLIDRFMTHLIRIIFPILVHLFSYNHEVSKYITPLIMFSCSFSLRSIFLLKNHLDSPTYNHTIFLTEFKIEKLINQQKFLIKNRPTLAMLNIILQKLLIFYYHICKILLNTSMTAPFELVYSDNR